MRSLNDIKSWFKTGKFPTENQFSEAWDSFWHKAESISISAVDSLQKILSSKADRELVDNQVNDLRQNKEDVGVARNLVEAHNVAPDAHQELFNLKANDAEVYHRDVLDSRFASHAEDEELHFTEEEKIKLHNVGKFVTNVGVEAGQQGGLNLMVGSVLPESSAATTVSSLELPLVTDQTNGLLSPGQKSVLDHLAIGGTSLTAEGTPSAVWQLNGSSGPKLKNSGNSFELRNAEDSAYTDLTVNNLSIKGSVVQEGGSFITQAETVEVKDNMILVNKGEISGGVSKGSAGIEVDRGTEENYRMIFDESDDRFKAGKGNDLHVVALRDADAAFADQHFVKWDAATHTFKDGGNSAPASDVYAWAKEPVKPSYTAAEVGAAASNHDHSGVYQPAGSYAPANHSHARSEIADFPTALPASDVYAWAKQPNKPTYNAEEVGAAPIKPFEGGEYKTQHKYENIAVDDTFLDSLELYSDNIVMNATITNNDLVIWNGDWLFRKSFDSTILAWNAPIELSWGFILKRSFDGHWSYNDDIEILSLKKLNAKADKNHNHDTVYQPKGSYAPTSHTHPKSQITDFPTSMPASDVYSWAKQSTKPSYTPSEVGAAAANHNHVGTYAPVSHSHSADQISDTQTKVMMTASERSKLANFDPGVLTSVISLPAGDFRINDKVVIYQGNAAEVYNIKFAVSVHWMYGEFSSYPLEFWDKSTVDCIIDGPGNFDYHVRTITSDNPVGHITMQFVVSHTNNQWTITASWIMAPKSYANIRLKLDPRGLIVLKK